MTMKKWRQTLVRRNGAKKLKREITMGCGDEKCLQELATSSSEQSWLREIARGDRDVKMERINGDKKWWWEMESINCKSKLQRAVAMEECSQKIAKSNKGDKWR